MILFLNGVMKKTGWEIKRLMVYGSDYSSLSKIYSQRGAVSLSCSQRESLLLAFLAIFVFLIYSNTLQVPFTFDDQYNIEENHYLRLTQLSLEGLTRAGVEPKGFRPPRSLVPGSQPPVGRSP